MIRLPRRSHVCVALCPVAVILPVCYILFGRRFDVYGKNDNAVILIGTKDITASDSSPNDYASILDDYEFSKFLLPDSDRPPSAVESANLSYDQIRRGLFDNGSLQSSGVRFDVEGISSSDVLVFLHIQKTGGTTFERYLVRQLSVPRPCQCTRGRKRCKCRRPNDDFWLFSRFSNGWPCGLHADYTELIASGCVQRVLDRQAKGKETKRRRYFLTTFLREPVSRYYSEYRHVTQRGATWAAAVHVCNGRRATNDELPACYDPQTGWMGASLAEFVECPHNLGSNRQTRMLADLTLVNCYNLSGMSAELREATILRSAKVNLRRIAYFGLQEDMRRSQYVFERTFGLEFTKPLLNWNESSDLSELTSEQIDSIKRVNRLDIELYSYAKKLFDDRFRELKAGDALYEVNMAT